MSIAIVIGNGTSRLQFDLDQLHAVYETYGCNALIRDFIPNHVVVVDYPMIDEICTRKVQDVAKVYTQQQTTLDRYVKQYNLQYLPYIVGHSYDSGNWAVELAATHGHKTIYMIGFDYHQGSFNHVYAGSRGYNSKNYQQPLAKDHEWQRNLKSITKRHSDITFYRVKANSVTLYRELEVLPNYHEITPEQFKEQTYVRV